MQVWLNDSPVECPVGSSILQLIHQKHSDTTGCALAVNNNVIPHGEWPDYIVQDGDQILLFQVIAGG